MKNEENEENEEITNSAVPNAAAAAGVAASTPQNPRNLLSDLSKCFSLSAEEAHSTLMSLLKQSLSQTDFQALELARPEKLGLRNLQYFLYTIALLELNAKDLLTATNINSLSEIAAGKNGFTIIVEFASTIRALASLAEKVTPSLLTQANFDMLVKHAPEGGNKIGCLIREATRLADYPPTIHSFVDAPQSALPKIFQEIIDNVMHANRLDYAIRNLTESRSQPHPPSRLDQLREFSQIVTNGRSSVQAAEERVKKLGREATERQKLESLKKQERQKQERLERERLERLFLADKLPFFMLLPADEAAAAFTPVAVAGYDADASKKGYAIN